MNNQSAIIIVIIVVLAALGLWIVSSNGKPAATSPDTVNIDASRETNETTNMTGTTTQGTQSGTGTGVAGTVTVETTTTAPTVKNVTVTAANFSYNPASITVNKGDKVVILFKNTEGTHDIKIDAYGVNSGILQAGAQKTIEFTADKAGSFEYYCSVGNHRQMGMKGTLIVK